MWFSTYSPMLKPFRIMVGCLALKTTSTHVGCVPRFTCYRQDESHLDDVFTSVPVYDHHDAALSNDGHEQQTVFDNEILVVHQTLTEGTPKPNVLRPRTSTSTTRFAVTAPSQDVDEKREGSESHSSKTEVSQPRCSTADRIEETPVDPPWNPSTPLSGPDQEAQPSFNPLMPGGLACEVSDTERLDAVILEAKLEKFTMATPRKIRLRDGFLLYKD